MKVRFTKAPKGSKKAFAKAQKGAAITQMNLQDNGDNTLTVLGDDAAGNTMDISSIATLTPAPTSDNPAIVSVDAPSGMTFGIHAATPAPAIGAACSLTIGATWNDGSVGPFVITLQEVITAGPAGGIVVSPGTPTIH